MSLKRFFHLLRDNTRSFRKLLGGQPAEHVAGTLRVPSALRRGRRLQLEELESRVVPAVISVNPAQVIRQVNPDVLGVNLAWWDSALNTTQTQQMVQAAGLTMFRFPGGSSSDTWHFNAPPTYGGEGTTPSMARFIASAGGVGMVTLNYGTGSPQEGAALLAYLNGTVGNTTALGLGQEWNGTTWVQQDWKTAGYWASLRAAPPLAQDDGLNFLRLGRSAPFGFHYYEVGNEIYGVSWETDNHGSGGDTGKAHDPATYVTFAKQFAAYAAQIDATISIGQDTGSISYDNNWTSNVLHQDVSQDFIPGFLSDHVYMQGPGSESDSGLLFRTVTSTTAGGSGSPDDWSLRAAGYRNLLTQVLGSNAGHVELLATETNSVYANPGKQSTSLVNGLYLADSIGGILQTEYNALDFWDLRNGWSTGNNNSSSLYGWRQGGDYGLLGAGGTTPSSGTYVPYPTYFAEQLISKMVHAGDTVVQASSSDANLDVYAVKEANGHLDFLVINKNATTDYTGQFQISGFTPYAQAQLWQYGKTQDTAQSQTTDGHAALAGSSVTLSLTPQANAFDYAFPSYSMSVLDVTPRLPTTTVMSASAANVTYGQAVTFTAAVSASGSTPAGSVDFLDQTSGVLLGHGRLQATNNGTATWTYVTGPTQLKATGSTAHTIQADYAPAPNFLGSSGTLAGGEKVNPAPLTLAAVACTKCCDGTTSAPAVPTVAGLQGSDTVVGLAETYDSTTLGTGKTLTPSGTVNDGNGGNNYTVTVAPSATGAIVPAAFSKYVITLFTPTNIMAGEQWISLADPPTGNQRSRRPSPKTSGVSFQYKGIMPALHEASRVSFTYRHKLDYLVSDVACSHCQGSRLRDDAAACRFQTHTIGDIGDWPLSRTLAFFKNLKLSKDQQQIAGEILREIKNRVQFLVDVGLDYVTLSRPTPTLSGGESQRIRLASQIGSGLTGVLYVLDEPTIGLHPRDNRRLLKALQNLRDLGNTLVLVEHDREVIAAADHLLDFGPGAGDQGGEITAQGEPQDIRRAKTSLTGEYLSGKKSIPVPTNRRTILANLKSDSTLSRSTGGQGSACEALMNKRKTGASADHRLRSTVQLIVRGARQNNLKNIDVSFPLGVFIAVTGVSGSGKSSLIHEVLYSALAKKLHRAGVTVGAHDDIVGIEAIDKVISVDQDPLGNSPSSNPATYTGVFDLIRQLFAQLPESRVRGYQAKRFSFNKPGGRCEACEGNGQKKIEMHFLPDVWIECDVCGGSRFNPETLAVKYKGKSIAEVLQMRIREALELFSNIPKIRRILQTLADVGLDYVALGQPAPTLSGGEAQRVKLAAELGRPNTGRTLYILDEPTTGLHFDDIRKLLDVLNRLVDLGNTVIVVEHNLDVIKTADWVIDMGPEAGAEGGHVVAEGTPEAVASSVTGSHTAGFLKGILAAGPHTLRPFYDPHAAERKEPEKSARATPEDVVAVPWETDGRRWHTGVHASHTGNPCRWEGKVLESVERQIHALGRFAETNWKQPTTVEITGPTKSHGWFFHAHTGMEWLVRLVFRVARNAFKQEELEQSLNIPVLDDTTGVEIYGNEPRVRVSNRKGPWQEVWMVIHRCSEIDSDSFRQFLKKAVESFHNNVRRMQTRPEDLMPWKIHGERWHLGEKGFPPGRKLKWDRNLLPRLLELVRTVEPNIEIKWDNRVAITLRIPDVSRGWAQWRTKDADCLDCRFLGKKGHFNLSQVDGLGAEPALERRSDGEVLHLSFLHENHLHPQRLKELLAEHLRGFRETFAMGEDAVVLQGEDVLQ